MIKTIASNNTDFLKVTTSSGVYISPHSNTMNVSGALRFNPISQTLEVYDGNAWQNILGHAEVSLTQETIEILNWAREQKNKQKEIEKWAENHPTVAAAYQSVKTAQEQLDIVTILCRDEMSSRQQQ